MRQTDRQTASYLDVSAVGGEVHLHHKAGDVPAAVDAVELRAECQVVEVHRALGGAYSQVTRVWTEPMEKEVTGETAWSDLLFNV